MEIYLVEELDKLDDWTKMISLGIKVMEGLHDDFQQIKNKAKEKFLEADKYYNVSILKIFEDKSKTNLSSLQNIVQQFKNTFKNASWKDDVKQTFKNEEAMLELDTKLEDFTKTRI